MNQFIHAIEIQQFFMAKILHTTNGGWICAIGNSEVFLPGSQLYKQIEDYEAYVGKSVRVMVQRSNKWGTVVSHRDYKRKLYERNEILTHLKRGQKLSGVVKGVTEKGLLINVMGIIGFMHNEEILPPNQYEINSTIEFSVLKADAKNSILLLSQQLLKHQESIEIKRLKKRIEKEAKREFISKLKIDDPLNCIVKKAVPSGYVVEFSNNITSLLRSRDIPKTRTLGEGENLEVVVSEIDFEKTVFFVSLTKLLNNKWEQLSRFVTENIIPMQTILVGHVVYLERDVVTLQIEYLGQTIYGYIKKEDLAWEKILNAADVVFLHEELSVKYLYEEKRKFYFDLKWQQEEIYPQELFHMNIDEVLTYMDIQQNSFVAQVSLLYGKNSRTGMAEISGALAKNIMPVNKNDQNIQLIDQYTGANISAFIPIKYAYGLEEGKYYKFKFDIASSEKRISEHQPFMFTAILDGGAIPVDNPYQTLVENSFKANKTPKSNRELASDLAMWGADMYSDRDRMIYELLQNADDSSSKRGVNVMMQIKDNFLILTHDGFSFSRQDFRSIVSTANSTKRLDRKKTGYKGIGFKSVFTDSEKVYIRTGGFNFVFDKRNRMFSDFKDFYRYVNPLYTENQFRTFLEENNEYEREFEGVDHLPWQLLPFWMNEIPQELQCTSFSRLTNVAIALDLGVHIENYKEMIRGIIEKPRFMLFLRNMKRIQYEEKQWEILSIAKIKEKDSDVVHLKNSMFEDSKDLAYISKIGDDIEVSNDSFQQCNIPLRKERQQIGMREKWLMFQLIDGREIPVTSIPERVIAADTTTISYAIMLSENGDVKPLDNSTSSLYAFLPMEERNYLFPFYINADFELTPNRQQAKPISLWNEFIFYNIGAGIVRWISDVASINRPNYLCLLPPNLFVEYLEEGKCDRLAVQFNKAYKEALKTIPFILDETRNLSRQDEIIIDESELSSIISNNLFRLIIKTDKNFVSPQINSSPLINNTKLFSDVEIIKGTDVVPYLRNSALINGWITTADAEKKQLFLKWLAKNIADDTDIANMLPIFTFHEEMLSVNQLSENGRENYIICTDNVIEIKDLLIKLGFCCSIESITNHPLVEYLNVISEEKIFEKVKEKTIDNNLTPEEKRRLLFGLKTFKNVDDAKVKSLLLLKNKLGEYRPISLLCNSNKLYLDKFTIASDEYDPSLDKLLVKSSEISSTFFKEKYINDLFTTENIQDIYADYGTMWQQNYWDSLVDTLPASAIIQIISEAQISVKKKFLEKLPDFNLESRVYTEQELEYRCFKEAQDSGLMSILLGKTYIDGELVSKYNIKNDINFTIERIQYTLQLSEILPARKTNIMEQMKKCFPFISIELKELDKGHIIQEIAEDVKTKNLTPAQFIYVCLWNKSRGVLSYAPFSESQIKKCIEHSGSGYIIECINYCFNHSVNIDIYQFRNEKGINFGIKDKFFKHDRDLLLPKELLPMEIQNWANSEEKRNFLYDLGVRKSDNSLIKLRSAWLDGLDCNEKASEDTFTWIAEKALIYLEENADKRIERINLLKKLLDKNYERRSRFLCEQCSFPWHGNSEYKNWTMRKGVDIKVCPKGIPVELYHGTYNYCIIYEDNFYIDNKTIFISGVSEAKDILRKITAVSNIFTIEDWYHLFSVSSDAYDDLQREKDSLNQRIAELERKLYELQTVSPTIGAGDDDNISKQKQKEAQLEAQKYLLSMQRGIWQFPIGYGELNDAGELNCFSKFHVVDADGCDMLIVLKSYKYRNEPFKINPIEWDSIMEEGAHMFIYTGNDIVEIDKEEIVKNQTKIAVRFSAENLDVKEKIQEFSDLLHYFNDIHFDFESFNITKKAKSIREIYNKREGGQLDNSLGAI